MNIIERGRAHLQSLVALAKRTVWDWKRCPMCGGTWTSCWGTYQRHPWSLAGERQTVRVQRHKCYACNKTYSEQSALLVRGSWYARDVHRCAVDHWQHGGTSLRRTAEFLRSWLGHQERWLLWRPLDHEGAERCYLAASTVHRWLDAAGQTAKASVDGQLVDIAHTQAVGTDGLWAKLKGQAQRVVLLVVDSVSGLVYPPLVAKGEESAGPWQRLFERAQRAGLDLDALRGVTSDGAQGLLAYLRRSLAWVQQQRCVWHLWRNLGGELARAAAKAAADLTGEAAEQARQQVRDELGGLIHQIMDATATSRRKPRSPRCWGTRWAPPSANCSMSSWIGCWCTSWPTTKACRASRQSGTGATSASDSAGAATIARSSAWSGRRWSGPSTTTSSPLSGGQSANAITGTPAKVPWKSPERHPDK